MQDNFDDKDIAMEQKYIEEKLKAINDYLIIPDSIRPGNIQFKNKKKKNFRRITAAAAAFVIIISMVTIIYFVQTFQDSTIVSMNPKQNRSLMSDDYKIKSEMDSDFDLKMTYSKLINNSCDIMDSNSVSSKSVYGDSYTVSEVDIGDDAGDIVKTDGEYIYTLSSGYERSGENNLIDKDTTKVNIISTFETGEMELVGSIDINGQATEMYLVDKRLIVVTRPEPYYIDLTNNNHVSVAEFDNSLEEFYKNSTETDSDEVIKEFYERYQFENRTEVLVYDVSNINNPVLTRKFTQDGYYSSSKLINSNFYLITNKYDYTKNYDNIEEINPKNILPFTNDSQFGEEDQPIGLNDITVFSNPNSYEYTVISGFNLMNNEKAVTKACLGGVSATYSSSNYIYFASTDYSNAEDKIYCTNIIKYSLNNGVPKLHATGQVPGAIINKSSLDEFDNYFRVATVDDSNNIYVLDNDLKIVGKAESILLGDQISSVRFINESGYVTTNRSVDPLFMLDLSNPIEPKVSGKVKIPGFSSYLCSYSEDKFIGVGKDIQIIKNSQGVEVTLTEGIKLSFFDMSDPDNPVELKTMSIGGIGTSSEVLYDSKSLLLSKDSKLLALPITLYENANDSTDPFSPGVFSYIGYYIFNIDENGDFIYKDKVTHYDELPDYTNTDDNNFFDNIGYEISRGVEVGEVLYTISEKIVMANSLSDFKELGKIELKK